MRRRGLLLATPALAAAGASAQSLPDRGLRLVVPFAAGGNTDIFARRYAARLGTEVGQPVVVENRTGAAGAIGTQEVLRARPDGTALLFGGASTHAIFPLMAVRPPYDPVQDFAPVALLGASSVCFAARPEIAADLPALAARMRREPGRLRFGTPGTGSFLHMAAEMLRMEAGGLDAVHVPYRGSAPAMADLLAGHIDWVSDTLGTSLQHHQEGRVRMLAIASAARSPLAPEVPTVAEALGLPRFEASLWNMVLLRAGTPAPLVLGLHAATLRVLADPDFQAGLRAAAIEPAPAAGPEELGQFLRAELAKWAPVVAASGVRIE
jgi:tripartite-type tricarboxylate transporter receptor subunit TctC